MPRRVAHLVTEPDVADSSSEALRVSLLRLPGGVPLALTDTAALIWVVAAEGSENVVEDVARSAQQPIDAVRNDVEAFLQDLVRRGLLEPHHDSDQTTGGVP